MLPKGQRLTKQKDFDNVYRGGRPSFGGILSLRCAQNNLPDTRTAVIISNKISKKAVERNRIKRQIRYAVQKHSAKISSGYDCIFIGKPEIVGKDYKDIEKVAINLLRKQGLIANTRA
jgi:ribonuclease P protein component